MLPFEKGGTYCFAPVSRYVGMSVALNLVQLIVIMPPFEKGGAYCFAPVGRYVGMSVALNLVQLITQ